MTLLPCIDFFSAPFLLTRRPILYGVLCQSGRCNVPTDAYDRRTSPRSTSSFFHLYGKDDWQPRPPMSSIIPFFAHRMAPSCSFITLAHFSSTSSFRSFCHMARPISSSAPRKRERRLVGLVQAFPNRDLERSADERGSDLKLSVSLFGVPSYSSVRFGSSHKIFR